MGQGPADYNRGAVCRLVVGSLLAGQEKDDKDLGNFKVFPQFWDPSTLMRAELTEVLGFHDLDIILYRVR